MQETSAPFFSRQNVNSVRLIHLKRPREIQDPCDECGGPCDKSTHWRIRAHLRREKEEVSRMTIAHACDETCARKIYEQFRVEIALITGERPKVTKFDEGDGVW